MDPEIELSDLPDYSKARIEDIEDITKLITKRNLERQRMNGLANQANYDESIPYDSSLQKEKPMGSEGNHSMPGQLDDK